jgi:hypothetical protein
MARVIKFEGTVEVSLTDEQMAQYLPELEKLISQSIMYRTRFGDAPNDYRVYPNATCKAVVTRPGFHAHSVTCVPGGRLRLPATERWV